MNEVIVVTGGGRGLGLSIVRQVLASGRRVVVVSRTKTAEIESMAGDQMRFLEYDFSDLDGIHQLSKEIQSAAEKELGGKIYGLVNNAAIGTDGVLGTMHHTDIAKLINVNIQAPILLTKFISRNMMLRQTRGRIINIGSIIGSTGYSGLSVYAATKAAMEGFSRSLAREIGKRGITVNVVAPGFMETEMTSVLGEEQLDQIRRRSALKMFASPDSVADTVLHLLSPSAASITGTVLTIDGGSTA